MIIDGRSVSNNALIDTDVCIVGAGVAGVTLAREFRGTGLRVCVLESGGVKPDTSTQSLCDGENVGHPYFPLNTARSRNFGGSSYRWLAELGDGRLGARLRPLDAMDFEAREWIPHSGWPFDKKHVDPFYERAQAICRVGPYSYDVEDWEDPVCAPRLPLNSDRVRTVMFQLCSRDVFGKQYREEVRQAPDITTYLYATAVEVETARYPDVVSGIRVACPDGKGFRVQAKLYVLALGGIETPRLLLLSRAMQKNGLGNHHDMVGRFFMEHPHLASGFFLPNDPQLFKAVGLYDTHSRNGFPIEGKLALSEKLIVQERLLNFCTQIEPVGNLGVQSSISEGFHTMKALGLALQHGDIAEFNQQLSTFFPVIGEFSIALYRKAMKVFKYLHRFEKVTLFRLRHMTEQTPNPNSRVTLCDERDALGQYRVRLDWRLCAQDMHSIIRSQEIIDGEFRRVGLGRLKIELQDETPPPHLKGGWHHMGTTRMHVDPKQGVVDEHCRIHGMKNVFVAGSSVFPTAGYANPSLTVVALSVRLADHIKRLMDGKAPCAS
jgi:choline dehydrogenase-like flavoprotein